MRECPTDFDEVMACHHKDKRLWLLTSASDYGRFPLGWMSTHFDGGGILLATDVDEARLDEAIRETNERAQEGG